MTQFFSTARDAFGNVVPEATITVFDADTENLRDIFVDNAQSLAKLNPFTADENGFFNFFTDPGDVKIKVEKSGFPTSEIDFVPVPNTENIDLDTFKYAASVEFDGTNPDLVVASPGSVLIGYDEVLEDVSPGQEMTAALPVITATVPGVYYVANAISNQTGDVTTVSAGFTTSGGFLRGTGNTRVDAGGFDDGYVMQSNGLWFVSSAPQTIQGGISVLGGVSETFVAGALTLTVGLMFRL